MTDPEDEKPSIYHTLLSLYLSPPHPYQPQWGPALMILAKHGSRLPAISTLNLIPEKLPVKDLQSYFRNQIRSANTVANEARIVAGLWTTEVAGTRAKLLVGDDIPSGNGGRNRRVVVSDDRVCGYCHKRFGGSAIKVFPESVFKTDPHKRTSFADCWPQRLCRALWLREQVTWRVLEMKICSA